MKQVIKYAAIIFALMLSATIIGGCLHVGIQLVEAIAEKTGNSFPMDENTPLWYTEENGDLVVFGFRIGNNGKVKSGLETFDEPLESMYIEAPSGELIIETWENNYVQVDYKNIPEDYEIYLRDGVLVIEEEDFVVRWGFGFLGNAELTISVPEGITLTEATVESGSGKVEISGLIAENMVVDSGSGSKTISDVTADTLYLDSGSGSVNVSNVTAKETVLSSGSGSVTVVDSVLGGMALDSGSGFCTFDNVTAENMVVDSGSGRIKYTGILTGNCVFDTGSGSVNLELQGKEEDYNIRADLGSGGLYINGDKEKNTDIEYRNASNLLVFDTGSGRVSIQFNED